MHGTLLPVMFLTIAFGAPALAEEFCANGRLIPAQYVEREVEVIYEAHERLFVVPATYKTVTEVVVDAPAHCPGEKLKTVTQTVVLEEPTEVIRVVPAYFERVTSKSGERRMIVKQPATVRRVAIPPHPPQISIKVRDPHAANSDCPAEDMIPASTRQIERRVIATLATVRSEHIPETVRTISERVLVAPARCEVDE